MGWASIRDKIYKIGEKIEPHAYVHTELQKTATGQKVFGKVEKGVATYAAPVGQVVGLALNVVPGVGTAVGLGVMAGTAAIGTAAKYKLARDNQIKAIKDEEEYQRKYAEEVAAYNADPATYNASLASPVSAFAPAGGAPLVPQTPEQAQQGSSNLPLALLGGGAVVVVLFAFLVFRK
jgi:hypothetical protein